MPTLSANGDTKTFRINGPVYVHMSGTFGSGTITWKINDGDGNYKDMANGAFTAAADKRFNFAGPVVMKGTLAGATGPSLFYGVSGDNVQEIAP